MKKGGVEKEEKEKRKKEKKERKENKKRDRGSMTAEELLRLDEVSTKFDDTNTYFYLHFYIKKMLTLLQGWQQNLMIMLMTGILDTVHHLRLISHAILEGGSTMLFRWKRGKKLLWGAHQKELASIPVIRV
jgi:hypothetical protein